MQGDNQNAAILRTKTIDSNIFTFTKDYNMGVLLHPESIALYKKLNSCSKIISVCEIGASFSVDESYKSLGLIREEEESGKDNKFVISSNIHRYYNDWGKHKIIYLKKVFMRPVMKIDSKVGIVVVLTFVAIIGVMYYRKWQLNRDGRYTIGHLCNVNEGGTHGAVS